MGLCFIFSGSSVGAIGVGPCMGTKQSSRVTLCHHCCWDFWSWKDCTSSAFKGRGNWDINWKKLEHRNEKNHMWHQPELRGDVVMSGRSKRSGVPQYMGVHHSESKWYSRSIKAIHFWLVSVHLCPMAAQAPTPSPACSCPCSLQGWWAAALPSPQVAKGWKPPAPGSLVTCARVSPSTHHSLSKE